MTLVIEELVHRYGKTETNSVAVDRVSLRVSDGEFFTLLGPSGCGKSTTLRCVAGLESPTSGKIEIGGRAVFDDTVGINMRTQKRNIGMVFQSYAIWPHMSVLDNVLFPLSVDRAARHAKDRTRLAMESLERVGLGHMANRPAPNLSGGQQQRVAVARALVKKVDLLLLDEPLSNLDAKLRIETRRELRELQRSLGITTLFVTHDQQEALSMSDRIAVMDEGRVVEVGSPESLYLHPRDSSTAVFLGGANVLKGTSQGQRSGGAMHVRLDSGQTIRVSDINTSEHHSDSGTVASVFIRPEHIELLDQQPAELHAEWNDLGSAIVTERQFAGNLIQYTISFKSGSSLRVETLSTHFYDPGRTVYLRARQRHCILVNDSGSRRSSLAAVPQSEAVGGH